MENNPVVIEIAVPFPSKLLAETVYNVLVVDSEPKRSHVTKELNLEDTILQVKFSATLAKHVRVAVTGFFESLNLIVDTINFTGVPTHQGYLHH